MSVDVRRTKGGLRLLLTAIGGQRRNISLGYGEAAQLIQAIESSRTCSVHGGAGWELCHRPDACDGISLMFTQRTAESDGLIDDEYGTGHFPLDGGYARQFAAMLRAHMPDRMRPFA